MEHGDWVLCGILAIRSTKTIALISYEFLDLLGFNLSTKLWISRMNDPTISKRHIDSQHGREAYVPNLMVKH